MDQPHAAVPNLLPFSLVRVVFRQTELQFHILPSMDWATFHSIELLKVNVRDTRAQNPAVKVPDLLALLQGAAAALTMVLGFLDPPGAQTFPRINAYGQNVALQTLLIAGACALDDLSGLQDSVRPPNVRDLITEAQLQIKEELNQLSGCIAQYMCGLTMLEAFRLEKAVQGALNFLERYLSESPDPLLEDLVSALADVSAKAAEIQDHWPQTIPMMESAGS